MDPLPLLREKAERLAGSRAYTGLLAVLQQLDVAARHFTAARSDGQTYLHTDVLLRLDRAVAGIVSELYGSTAAGDASEMGRGEIERFVLEQAGLPERSVALLRHHLGTWRPALERDLQFAAGEQEAYLAFLGTAALLGVLFDDLARLEAYAGEKRRAAAREASGQAWQVAPVADSGQGQRLDLRLQHLLEVYARTFGERQPAAGPPTEGQLRGRLRGFLETVLPATSLLPDPPLRSPSGILRPSFIVAEGDETVVLEVRRAVETESAFERSFVTEQMMMYLLTSGVSRGIIALLPDGGGELTASEGSFGLDGKSHVIVTLRPAAG